MARQMDETKLSYCGRRISEVLLESDVSVNVEEVLAADPGMLVMSDYANRVREAVKVLKIVGAIREVGHRMLEWLYKGHASNLRPADEFVFVTNEELERAQRFEEEEDGISWMYTNPSNTPGEGSQQYKVLRHGEIDGMPIYHFEAIPQNVASASTTTTTTTTTHGETSGRKRKATAQQGALV